MFALTSTLGVRETPVSRVALERDWRTVARARRRASGSRWALRAGRIVTATPEFDDAAALARARDVPVRQVLDEAVAAAEAAALRPGRTGGAPPPQAGAAI